MNQRFFRELAIIPSIRCNFKIARIQAAVKEAELDLRGWPVLHLRDNLLATDDNGVECFSDDGGASFLNWRIQRSGLIFHQAMTSESWLEEKKPQEDKLFDPVIRIFEMTEEVAVFTRFYQFMGISPDASMEMRFSWPNAKGRLIAYHGNWTSISVAEADQRKVPINTPTSSARIPVWVSLEDIPPLIVPLWRALISDLTEAFNSLEDQVIIDWATKVLKRQPLR